MEACGLEPHLLGLAQPITSIGETLWKGPGPLWLYDTILCSISQHGTFRTDFLASVLVWLVSLGAVCLVTC